MTYKKTTAVDKILALKKRLRIVQGGSSAGKTIAILLILIERAQREENKIFSVVSESFPHLRRGAIRDFLSIMEAHGYFVPSYWNKTEFIYSFPDGSKIEFFSVDQPGKVRGPRRDVLFINEANNINFEAYTQLAIRTNEDIYIDYNPVIEFWVHTEIIPSLEHDFIILTYLDNEGLAKSIIQELEARRGNKPWWRVYGEGHLGEIETRIYRNWAVVDEVPHEARLERYGLDFGYSNDPTAIVAIYYYNGGYILDEITFQKGLSNKMIADIIVSQPKKAIVVADSAEPKSIDEIKMYGIDIIPTVKGKGSVTRGIQYVQDQQISMTKISLNLRKEYNNYVWITDKDGKILNEPDHQYSHSMDAIRYGMENLDVNSRPTREDANRIMQNRLIRQQSDAGI